MLDEVDAPLRPRRPRAKDSFQMELKAKMTERKAKGLTVDLTSEESEEDSSGATEDMYSQYAASQRNRPGSAKRRPDHAGGSTWTPGLGDLLRSKDIDKLMGRKTPSLDDYDDEIDQVMNNKISPYSFGQQQSRTTPPGGLLGRKTPTNADTKESLLGRKAPTKDDGKSSIFGRKTLSRESPLQEHISKEDIIFGRKTPTNTNKSPTGDLPGLGGTWQPPNFRLSPTADQRGRSTSPANTQGQKTPSLEPGLDSISEKHFSQEKPPRHGRMDRGREKESPRLSDDSPLSDRPTPHARHKIVEKEDTKPARTTPTLDLFGKTRNQSSFEIESELKNIDEKKEAEEARQRRLYGKQTPTDRKTPTGDRKTPPGDRKTPTGDRKTPTERKSPGPARQSETTGRKTPVDLRGRKTPTEQEADEMKPKQSGPSLMEMINAEVKPEKPQPKERPRQRRNVIPKDTTGDMFTITSSSNRDTMHALEPRLKDGGDARERMMDESSVCEEVKEDPQADLWRNKGDSEDSKKQVKQRSERQRADEAITMIENAQNTMKPIHPSKKIRPISAEAKVQHRPKPRYGTLPGQAKTPMEVADFNSTIDIREAVYVEWYKQRIKKAKQEQKLKEQKEKEEQEKKKKAQEEKQTNATESYKAWQEQKKVLLSLEKAKKEKEEEKKRQKEEQEKEDKLKESEVTFKIWKEKKDQTLKVQIKEKKLTEQEKKELEAEEKRNKEKISMTAFSGWKKSKDKELKQKVVEEQQKKKKKVTTLEATRRQKEEEAAKGYETWMADKEKQEQRQKLDTRRKMSAGDIYDFRPPWSPANCTVPFGR